MKSSGGHPMPQAMESLPERSEQCACGGTIRARMRWQTYEQLEAAITTAVRLHQATERHQAYMRGEKYL